MDVYKNVSEKLWDEAEVSLGLKEETEGNPRRFVEAFLDHYDEQDNIHYQSLIMEPIQKSAKQSEPSPQRPKPLTSRQRKKIGWQMLSKKEQKYSLYEPLHELWKGYINELLKPTSNSKTNLLAQKMLKADFHGCKLKVSRSRCASVVGLQGIVLQETQNTFKIIGIDDRVRTIPKTHTVFTFTALGYKFTIYGQNMMYRSSDRSARKYKDKLFKEI